MQADLVARYSAPVPRYTSYPTAPHFHAGVSAACYRDWLAELGDEQSLSLYLHVPFCAQMCWYCGCHTKVVQRYEPVKDYVGDLGREIDLVATAIESRPRVTHVHWGGGTPTMLAAEDFAALMETLRGRFRFAGDAEVAVEIDPRGLTEAKAGALAAAGVTRASLGVQDFTPRVQAAINRVQPYAVTAAAVERLRGAGIAAINFDLMYGLPGQGRDELLRSIDLASGLGPDRVALFGYAHVPWMKTHQRMIDTEALPDAGERLAQSEAAAQRLVERGYRRIGLDHFALPGDSLTLAQEAGRLRRNFQGYTDDPADALLGFGASAIGALPQGYLQNAVPFGDYSRAVRDGCLAVVKGLRLSPEDRLRGAVIERLMCDLEVDLDAVARACGSPGTAFEEERAELEELRGDGLVAIDGGRVAVTERGRPFLRSVCAKFDAYLSQPRARHSSGI